jgi:hypothetical protein
MKASAALTEEDNVIANPELVRRLICAEIGAAANVLLGERSRACNDIEHRLLVDLDDAIGWAIKVQNHIYKSTQQNVGQMDRRAGSPQVHATRDADANDSRLFQRPRFQRRKRKYRLSTDASVAV